MGTILDSRRKRTDERINALQTALAGATPRAQGKACVYISGSFARGEAGGHSDLDLFIVGRVNNNSRALSRLDETCLKADLIHATRQAGIPDFSGDGEYLNHYTVDDLVKTLGTPEDDAENTFTARLLLLLESRPLIEPEVYADIIGQVIVAYWRDYEDNKDVFMPAFLTNDILRLWRTFCVNYEARTKKESEEKRAKRRLKNYKLKHSRLLTCYSALIYLLAVYRATRTVTIEECVKMVNLAPTRRLEELQQEKLLPTGTDEVVANLVAQYERFLQETDASEQDLITLFLDKQRSAELLNAANEFGDIVFRLMDTLRTNSDGTPNKLFRRVLV